MVHVVLMPEDITHKVARWKQTAVNPMFFVVMTVFFYFLTHLNICVLL